jgi:hypothetical protein
MNSKIRSNVINGDAGGPSPAAIAQANQADNFVSASREARPGELEQLSAGAVVPVQPKHEPAFTPPQETPATPRDEHHGKGGMYALVDGKRVPADDEGNPLPADPAKK